MNDRVTHAQIKEAAAVVEDLQKMVSAKKYQLAGEDSFEDVLSRVILKAKANFSKYEGIVEFSRIERIIREGFFIPAGSILSGLGNKDNNCTLSNCYVTPIESDSIESIFDSLKKSARTYSYRGGVGTDITVLRPTGDRVNNSAKTSSGAVSFMPLLSEVTNTIGQNGRRGALLLSIDVRHPDVLKFIWCKSKPEDIFGKDFLSGKLPDVTGANISVKLTDDFMRAVEGDESWTFIYPDRDDNPGLYDTKWNGVYEDWEAVGGKFKSYQTVKAYDVLQAIAKASHMSGDPGVLFSDTVQDYTPGAHIHKSLRPITTNPCFTGDMRLTTTKGKVPLKDLAERDDFMVLAPSGRASKGRVWLTGVKNVVRATFKCKKRTWAIKCTPDHVFMQWGGEEIKAKDMLGCNVIYCAPGAGAAEMFPARVVNIENCGKEDVYDFEEPNSHWGVVEDIIVHNCGEQPIGPYNNCLLGAFVLSKYVVDEFTGSAAFQLNPFLDDVRAAVVFMNIMSDINVDLHPLKEQREADAFGRRIGIEFTALGDMLAMLGLRYDSEDARKATGHLLSLKAMEEIHTSADIAVKNGACPAMATVEARRKFLECPYVRYLGLSDRLRAQITATGLANTAFNTVGPTGSISIMSNNCTSGIEPLFMFAYSRQTRLDPDKYFNMLHKPALDYIEKLVMPENGLRIEDFKKELNYVEAWEIGWLDRIKMQAEVQKYTDSSISSTINLPEDATVETIMQIYLAAWAHRLKGITVFRDGCKKGVLTATKKEVVAEPTALVLQDSGEPAMFVKELLDEERARRYRVNWKGSKIYIIVTIDDDDKPLEVFAKLPREAGVNGGGLYSEEHFQEKYSLWECITRLTSLLLRSGMPVDKILKQLEKSSHYVADAPAILIRILRKFLNDGLEDVETEEIVQKELGRMCPDCKKKTYVYENGCGACKACGYTTCG